MIPLIAVILIVVATIYMGIASTKKAQTAADFFVAGRSVGAWMNAAAISGEYLSAASFMGVAGLVMKNGYDALWYPVGYATGYLFLLLFIAGPLRRFGAYTIPDFAEGRFDSPAFRKVAVIFVLFIGFFYTMPQMKGAGVTMKAILDWPYWVGIVVVGAAITLNVVLGGMKGITLVQAFQYWAKVFAISLPIFALIGVYGFYSKPLQAASAAPGESPRLAQGATIKVKGADAAPNNVLAFSASEPTYVTFINGAELSKIGPARKPEPGEDPFPVDQAVVQARRRADERRAPMGLSIPAKTGFLIQPVPVTKGGQPVMKDGKPVMTAAKFEFKAATQVQLTAPDGKSGPIAPNAPTNGKWVNPYGPMTSKWGFPFLTTISIIVALVCGTAGLPHILVRFYTNPDGKSARKTTFWVMIMLGAFYVFTPVWGVLGRTGAPELYSSNTTDMVVIRLPQIAFPGVWGELLSAITSAGAFAAFMSTFSGLLVSMSGAFAHDIYGKILRPESKPEDRLRAFKIAAVVVGLVSMGLGVLVESFDIATMVGWAFAIGAASYFPLLLLGAWWRNLTAKGAATGMLVGGLLSLTAIICHMLLDKKVLTWDLPPLVRALMEQPAIWGVPLSVTLMVLVSRATASTVPKDAMEKMLRLHAPEKLGLSKNYIEH